MLNKLTKYVISLGDIDEHAATTIAHDVILDPKAKGCEFKNAKFRFFKHMNRVVKKERERYVSLDTADTNDEEDFSPYEMMPYDDVNERNAALQDNQRQLITALVSGSDERTTLIVRTWLESDKPNANEIGKKLGIHHSTVLRAVRRLANNFSEAEHGKVAEYIYA